MDVIIGVDPHKASRHAFAIDDREQEVAQVSIRATKTQTERLLADAGEEVELLGPDGLLSEMTKAVLERALKAELTDHLGTSPTTRPGGGRATTATARTRSRC